MKKLKFVAVLAALMMMMSSSGCLAVVLAARNRNDEDETKKTRKTEDEEEDDEEEDDGDGSSVKRDKKAERSVGMSVMSKDFGLYTIDSNWVEVPSQSMPPDIFVYCLSGNEDSVEPPNNIVVRRGDNYYSKDEHEDFCTAILQQVSGQAAQFDGTAYLDSYGEINDCMVYKFVLDGTVYNEQWYFCGDHEYVMIGMTIYDQDEAENDNIRKVTEDLVNSFQWKE